MWILNRTIFWDSRKRIGNTHYFIKKKVWKLEQREKSARADGFLRKCWENVLKYRINCNFFFFSLLYSVLLTNLSTWINRKKIFSDAEKFLCQRGLSGRLVIEWGFEASLGSLELSSLDQSASQRVAFMWFVWVKTNCFSLCTTEYTRAREKWQKKYSVQ